MYGVQANNRCRLFNDIALAARYYYTISGAKFWVIVSTGELLLVAHGGADNIPGMSPQERRAMNRETLV